MGVSEAIKEIGISQLKQDFSNVFARNANVHTTPIEFLFEMLKKLLTLCHSQFIK